MFPRKALVTLSALSILSALGLKTLAQDPATEGYLKSLSGTRRAVAEIVIESVQQTGHKVVGIGSWLRKTSAYLDPLGTLPPGASPSDHDLRLVFQGLSDDAARNAWIEMRNAIQERVIERFKDPRVAQKVLASINLYPPDQLLKGAATSEEALQILSDLKINPSLSGGPFDGWFGRGTEAARQAYEASSGRVFFRDANGIVRSGLADIIEGESIAPRSIFGEGNLSVQLSELSREFLQKTDAKKLLKNLERLSEHLAKGRSMAGAGRASYLETVVNKLKASGKTYEEIAQALVNNEALFAEVEGAITKARLDAEALKILGGRGSALDAKFARELLEAGTKWGRFKALISSLSKHITIEAAVEFARQLVVWHAAEKAIESYYKNDPESASQYSIAAVSGMANLPAALLMLSIKALLDDAKELGYGLAIKQQDCQELIAGIYEVKGRERVGEDQRIERSIDQLALQYTTRDRVEGVVALHARNAATRNGVVDPTIEQKLLAKCVPEIVERWALRREQLITEASEILLAVEKVLDPAMLIATVNPEPVVVTGAAPAKEASVSFKLDTDVAALTQAINRFEATINPLGPNNQVQVSVRARYRWLLDGREIAKEEKLYSGVGQIFQDDLARRAISLAAVGPHNIEFHYTLTLNTLSTVDDVLAAKRFLTRTIDKKGTATVDVIDGNWLAKIIGPDTGKVNEPLILSADLSPATRQLKNLTLHWTNETARIGLAGGETVSFTPREVTPQRFTLEVFADIAGKELLVATAAKTVMIEGEEDADKKTEAKREETPPQTNPNAGKFSATVTANWEGGNTPQGFVLKRKPAKMKGPCGWETSVSASLEARFSQSAKPKNATEALALAESRFKARRQGDTPNDPAVGLFKAGGLEGASAFSIGDYEGAIADFALWMRRGSSGSGYTGSSFGASGVGEAVKQGGVISFSYHVNGAGCWDNSDRAYLVTQGAAAQEEARAILASLRLDEKGLITSKAYNGPKYDGSDLPRVVLVPSHIGKLKPGDTVKLEAVVENAKPEDSPFTYNWGGTFDGTPETSNKSNTVRIKPTKPGKYSVSVGVDGARFGLGTASVDYSVADYRVDIQRVEAANKPLVVGNSTGFKATLTVDGASAEGNFIYRWEPSTELNWSPSESEQAEAKTVFTKPGKIKVWVVVLEKIGEVLSTVAESEQIELDVANPALKIAFAPETAVVGAQVKASVKTTPADIKDIDFRWEISSNAQLLNESQDAREITFKAKDTNPVQVTARARVPASGEALGEATAKFAAKKFDVKVTVLGAQGAKPQVWKEGVGLVTVENAIAVHQNVTMRADVSPQVEGIDFRYEWSVNEDSHIVGSGISNEGRFNRSQTGTCVATVVVRDQNGLELGRGSGSFSVTISEEMTSGGGKRKEAADKLTTAKQIVRKGQLEEAITLAGQAATIDPLATEARTLAAQWTKERDTCLAQIEKTRQLMSEGKFPDASNALVVAKNLHPLYKPVQDMESQLSAEWRAWDSKIQNDIYLIRDANEKKEFKRALDLAAKRRAEGKIGPYEQALTNEEQWARRWETQKEQKRQILKAAEAKVTQYDYAGALKDFEQGLADFNNLWANSDPEPPYYFKLRDEAITRNKRIIELMSYISEVAGDPNARADLIETNIKNADEVLALQPTNADARRYRELLAARLVERSAKSSAAAFIRQGNDLYDKGNYQQALDAFNKALTTDPNSAGGYAGRCLTRRGLQDNAGALADCSRALELDPNNADAYRGRSMIKRATNDYPGALADANRAIDLAPDNYRSYLTRGLAKEALKDLSGALADYTRAIQLNSSYAMSYYYRGRVNYESKDYFAAIADYDRSIQINPDYAMSYFNRGRAKYTIKDYTGAIADYDRFILMNAKDKAAFNNRGLVKERLGDTAGAIADYEQAISLDPNYETARKNLANLRAKLAQAKTEDSAVNKSGTVDLVIFNSGNVYGVGNQPTAPATFTIGQPHVITSIMTYHWNNGRGTRPGTIALRDANGRTYGPWAATGTPGQGGVPNANWTCTPNIELPPGSYTIIDSEPETWSQNVQSGGRGMAVVKAYPTYATGKSTSPSSETPGVEKGYWRLTDRKLEKTPSASACYPSEVLGGEGNLTVNVRSVCGEDGLVSVQVRWTPPPDTLVPGDKLHIDSSLTPKVVRTTRGIAPSLVAYIDNAAIPCGGVGPGHLNLTEWYAAGNGKPGGSGKGEAAVPNIGAMGSTSSRRIVVKLCSDYWRQYYFYEWVDGNARRTVSAVKTPSNPPVSNQNRYLTAIFENHSSESTHVFVEGDSFNPGNRLAPGEKRSVQVMMTADGRIRFIGRNGQVRRQSFGTAIHRIRVAFRG